MKPLSSDTAAPLLLNEIRQLITASRTRLAVTVNAELTTLYWHVGQRIQAEIVQGQRAEYGQQVIANLSQKLTAEYGRGWSERNLAYMVRFADMYPDLNILHTLCAKLSWSHFRQLISLDDALKREFYTQMCVTAGWSTRLLQERMDSMLYERTALSKKPEQTISAELELMAQTGNLSPSLLFKDPYVLDFLQLNDRYLEKDLEDAILRELENFLLELGAGFTFVARQKRLQIDNDDFYIDLLFYNRRLKRLVAIDLKLGDFKAADKGQMELYLRWLAKHEQEPGEAATLGIILCSGKKQEQIELLELDASGIHVAEYLTELPPKALLQQKLHEAITRSRQRLDNRSIDQNGEEA
jgi:predicted nuclease of restriction endonuclease-like (RecB) superfamily